MNKKAGRANGPPRDPAPAGSAFTATPPVGRGMQETMPPGGWPLRMAVFALASAQWRDNANTIYDLEARCGINEPSRMILWVNDLAMRVKRGEVILRGRFSGERAVKPVPAELMHEAVPDFAAGTIVSGDLTIYNVTLIEAEALKVARWAKAEEKKPTGPVPVETRRVADRMRQQLEQQEITPEQLRAVKVEALGDLYGSGRTTCTKARAMVLSEFELRQTAARNK